VFALLTVIVEIMIVLCYIDVVRFTFSEKPH